MGSECVRQTKVMENVLELEGRDVTVVMVEGGRSG